MSMHRQILCAYYADFVHFLGKIIIILSTFSRPKAKQQQSICFSFHHCPKSKKDKYTTLCKVKCKTGAAFKFIRTVDVAGCSLFYRFSNIPIS